MQGDKLHDGRLSAEHVIMDDETQIREMEKDMARDAEEIRLLKGRMIELEAELIQESLRVDWLLARQYNHKTRESVDAEIFACGDL